MNVNKCSLTSSQIICQIFTDTIFQFVDNYNTNVLSTNPARIVPCVTGEPQHNYSNLSYTYSTFPGENFTISLAALDGGGKSIDTSVQVQFFGQNHRSLLPSSCSFLIVKDSRSFVAVQLCLPTSLTIHTKQLA